MSNKNKTYDSERKLKYSSQAPRLQTNVSPRAADVRISRAVSDPSVFYEAINWLIGMEKAGVLRARRLGMLGLTVFDSTQVNFPLSVHAPQSVESLTELLEKHEIGLFEPTVVPVKRAQVFGTDVAPFAAVTFRDDVLDTQQVRVKSLLGGPEKLSRAARGVRPHVTLAQQYSLERAREVISGLADRLPESVGLEPAQVVVRRKNST